MNRKESLPKKTSLKRKKSRKKKKTVHERPISNLQTGFLVAAYDGKKIKVYTTIREDVLALDLKSYDCCRAECLGVFGFRHPGTGKWINFGDNGHTIGPTCKDILETVQDQPGIRLDHYTLYMLTGRDELADGANVAACVYRLRKAFHEDKSCEHFILTDVGVAWRERATWIRVELTVKPKNECSAGAQPEST